MIGGVKYALTGHNYPVWIAEALSPEGDRVDIEYRFKDFQSCEPDLEDGCVSCHTDAPLHGAGAPEMPSSGKIPWDDEFYVAAIRRSDSGDVVFPRVIGADEQAAMIDIDECAQMMTYADESFREQILNVCVSRQSVRREGAPPK
jgi:hypothetical protein